MAKFLLPVLATYDVSLPLNVHKSVCDGVGELLPVEDDALHLVFYLIHGHVLHLGVLQLTVLVLSTGSLYGV